MAEENKVEEAIEQVVEEIKEKPKEEQREETPEVPSEEEPVEPTMPSRIPKLDRGESFWSPKELASKMSCTQSYIYLMIKQGKIKVVRQGRLVKISPEEVRKVLTDGLPLPPKPEAKLEAEEIVIEDERITKKLKPPTEPTEEPQPEKRKPGWPISILFK